MVGNHVKKKKGSSTQSPIALSSGEAEYYGCRAGSHALGLRSMLLDLGVTGKRLRIKTDASVEKSLASRRGLEGIRHIEVNQLW